MWITHTEEVLTGTALQHALAIESGKTTLDKNRFLQVKDLVSVCAGLVTHDTNTDIIRLVHYTTQDYFKKGQFRNADRDIAKACLAYLALEVFTEPCTELHELNRRRKEYNFSEYAVKYWARHTRDIQSKVEDEVLKTFQSHKKRESVCQMRTFLEEPWVAVVPSEMGMSLLHILCVNGLIIVCDAFIRRGVDFDDLYVVTLSSAN